MQRTGYTKGLSAPSSSELEAFDKLFDSNMTASNAKALDALFPAVGNGRPYSHEDVRPPPRSQSCVDIGCFLLCNIESICLLLG